jgi:hypothetical protein
MDYGELATLLQSAVPWHGVVLLTAHNWLYLHDLDCVATIRRLVAFHVEQHNTVIPHPAFHGETPDEMYFGTGEAVAATLAEQRALARQQRLVANRARSCDDCDLLAGHLPLTPQPDQPPWAVSRDGEEPL